MELVRAGYSYIKQLLVMAQYTGIGIDIGGKKLKQFTSLSLSQSIFDHHSFRVVCPAEAIDGTTGTIFNSSKQLIGGKFTLQIEAIGGAGTLEFSGLVTQIEAARSSGHAGDIVISGYSSTILMDNGPHCKSWEKKTVEDIAKDVLKHFPEISAKSKLSPTYKEKLSYCVQYKETAWQFLNRLSAAHGEWLFFDGEYLVLGNPQGNEAKLVYGSNLPSFSMAIQVRPPSFQMLAYDFLNTDVYDGKPEGTDSKAGLNELGKHAFQKSETFYSAKPKQWHNHFLTSKKQLDDFVNIRAAMQSSNLVHFNGSSGHPGITIGGSISVEGKNVFSESDESFGKYTVISVHHYCDGQGNYSNDFVAIPSSVKKPPVTTYTEPHCETQSALVTDNYDKDSLGRIRVKFHWMNGNEKSPWIRIATMHGGSEKGSFFIPEINEEVIVGFEGDSPVKPYILGTVYNSKANAKGIANDKNDIKQLKTRSGHTIKFDDIDEGSITISTPGGNVICFDDKDKSISISGTEHVNVSSKSTISISSKQIAITGEEIGIEASKTISIKGKDEVNINSDMQVVVHGTETLSCSAKNIGVDADMDLKLNSGTTACIQSNITNVQGSAMVNIN